MLLLDTDVLIDIQRGRPQALEWFSRLTELPAISGLVAMELIQGAPTSLTKK
jgi:predicted nucleic acid-binding protein